MDDDLLSSIFEVQGGRLFWINPPKNHAEKRGREAGFLCVGKGKNKTYWHIRVFGMTFKRSRIIYRMVHGYWPHPAVDHINGDSLDDRPENLRVATQSQNTASAKRAMGRAGLPKGVCATRQGRFMARLTVEGHTRSLGTYETPQQAEAVYLLARKEAFHEFA